MLKVKEGVLVSIAIYDSVNGHKYVASPDWLDPPKHLLKPGLHTFKSRTRAVSALVVGSRSVSTKHRPMLRVIVDDEEMTVPLACVIEVLRYV